MQSNRSTERKDSIPPSIDELVEKFEQYKKRKELEKKESYSHSSFNEELSKVQNQYVVLCRNIASFKSAFNSNNLENKQQLSSSEISEHSQNQSESKEFCDCELSSNKCYTSASDIDALTDVSESKVFCKNRLDSSARNHNTDFLIDSITDVAADKEHSNDEFKDEELFIKCKSTKSMMGMCQYCGGGEIMMVHYLSDQSVLYGFKKCYELTEDNSIVLSFDPKYCEKRHNQVMGSLSFSGATTKDSTNLDVNSNSYARKPLNCCIPLSVIITKIDAGCGAEILKQSDQCKRHLFIIWLLSPYNRNDIEATLSIYGRDPIDTMETKIKVHHGDSLEKFMKIDGKFWQLSNSHIEKLSNGYRDELHLKVRLTEYIH